MRKTNRISIPETKPFDLSISYIELDRDSPENEFNHHTHPECEIYINLAGDVSFMVENTIYPVTKGDIIITRPFEYHHCIYHTKTRHRHFWILFSGLENQRFLDLFFERRKGDGNLLMLEPDAMQELVELCFSLCRGQQGELEKYFCFFKLLRLLEQAKTEGAGGTESKTELASVFTAIHQRYGEKLSVKELAEMAHISISTLERWFEETLHTTPTAYIRRIRLVNAARLLSERHSVTETANLCGFSDVSAMIGLFKKQYGMTPFQYQKQLKQK